MAHARTFQPATKWVNTSHQLQAMAAEGAASALILQIQTKGITDNKAKCIKAATKYLHQIKTDGSGLQELTNIASIAFNDAYEIKRFKFFATSFAECIANAKAFEQQGTTNTCKK